MISSDGSSRPVEGAIDEQFWVNKMLDRIREEDRRMRANAKTGWRTDYSTFIDDGELVVHQVWGAVMTDKDAFTSETADLRPTHTQLFAVRHYAHTNAIVIGFGD